MPVLLGKAHPLPATCMEDARKIRGAPCSLHAIFGTSFTSADVPVQHAWGVLTCDWGFGHTVLALATATSVATTVEMHRIMDPAFAEGDVRRAVAGIVPNQT